MSDYAFYTNPHPDFPGDDSYLLDLVNIATEPIEGGPLDITVPGSSTKSIYWRTQKNVLPPAAKLLANAYAEVEFYWLAASDTFVTAEVKVRFVDAAGDEIALISSMEDGGDTQPVAAEDYSYFWDQLDGDIPVPDVDFWIEVELLLTNTDPADIDLQLESDVNNNWNTYFIAFWTEMQIFFEETGGPVYGDLEIPTEIRTSSVFSLISGDSLIIPTTIITTQSGDLEIPTSIETSYAHGDLEIPTEIRSIGSGDCEIPTTIITLGASQKWRKRILLAGIDVSARILGEVTTEGNEGGARLAEFKMMPLPGSIDPFAWVGASVVIDHVSIEGDAEIPRREFTGIVSEPPYDVTERTVTFMCTDNLQRKVADKPAATLDYLIGGRFDSNVQGEPTDNWDYAQKRMESVPGSLDASPTGALRVTPWNTDALWRVYDLSNTEFKSVSFTQPQRDNVVNRIDGTFEFRFTRLHRASVGINYSISFMDTVNYGLPLLTRETVKSALGGSGWSYYYGGAGVGIDGSAGSPVFGSGNQVPAEPIINFTPYPETYEFPPPSHAFWSQNEVDTTCMAFGCRLYKRWAQTVTETYKITVLAPESIAKLGEIANEDRASLASEWDPDGWEADILTAPHLTAAGSYETQDYSPDVSTEQRDYALATMVDVYTVRILGSHRSGRASGVTFHTVELDLDKRIAVQTPYGETEGKVVRVVHRSDMNTGRAVTEFEVAYSAHGAVGLPPIEPTPVEPPEPPAVQMPTTDWISQLSKGLTAHIGGLPTSEPYDENWEGWIVNVPSSFIVEDDADDVPHISAETQKTERVKINDEYEGSTTNPVYDPSKAYSSTGFRVVMPAVESLVRDAAAPEQTATYQVVIPQDTFELSA
jgi:hypothetical protein